MKKNPRRETGGASRSCWSLSGRRRFRSADFPSALDTPATNTSVTNPTMAQTSDAQSRSETGAPAEVTGTLAGKADAGAVNVWCACVRPASDQVRPKKMNEPPKGKIGRLPQAVQEQVNRRLEKDDFGAPTSRRHWTPRHPTRPLRIQPWHNLVTRKAGQRPALRPRSPTTSGVRAGGGTWKFIRP